MNTNHSSKNASDTSTVKEVKPICFGDYIYGSEAAMRDCYSCKYEQDCKNQTVEEAKKAVAKQTNALEIQIDGNHYKDCVIQPVEYIHANGLNFLEGCVIKRITRWRDKGGIKDLEKIKHEVDLLICMEKKYGKR